MQSQKFLYNQEQRKRGVIAASAGNHALALAHHGRQLGVPVAVMMPEVAPLMKVVYDMGEGVCVCECECVRDMGVHYFVVCWEPLEPSYWLHITFLWLSYEV